MATENRPAGGQIVIRINPDKTIRGRHWQFTEQVVDLESGAAIAVVDGPAIPISDAEGAMLLQDALDELTAAAVQAADVEQQARIAAESARDTAAAQRDEAIAERDARAAERDALQAEVDALRGRSANHVRKSVILRRMTAAERRAWRQAVKRAGAANNPTAGDLYAEDAMMIFEHVGPAMDASDPDAHAFGLALVAAGVLANEARVDEILQPES